MGSRFSSRQVSTKPRPKGPSTPIARSPGLHDHDFFCDTLVSGSFHTDQFKVRSLHRGRGPDLLRPQQPESHEKHLEPQDSAVPVTPDVLSHPVLGSASRHDIHTLLVNCVSKPVYNSHLVLLRDPLQPFRFETRNDVKQPLTSLKPESSKP